MMPFCRHLHAYITHYHHRMRLRLYLINPTTILGFLCPGRLHDFRMKMYEIRNIDLYIEHPHWSFVADPHKPIPSTYPQKTMA